MNRQKEFTNPNPENENKEKKFENNSHKNNNVNETKEIEFNTEEQGIKQDLILNNVILEEKKNDKNEKIDKNIKEDKNDKDMNEQYEVKDSDFDNFPEDYDPEAEYEQKNLVFNLNNTHKHKSLLYYHENNLKNMNVVTESKNICLQE